LKRIEKNCKKKWKELKRIEKMKRIEKNCKKKMERIEQL
jgi:hypothetical protein